MFGTRPSFSTSTLHSIKVAWLISVSSIFVTRNYDSDSLSLTPSWLIFSYSSYRLLGTSIEGFDWILYWPLLVSWGYGQQFVHGLDSSFSSLAVKFQLRFSTYFRHHLQGCRCSSRFNKGRVVVLLQIFLDGGGYLSLICLILVFLLHIGRIDCCLQNSFLFNSFLLLGSILYACCYCGRKLMLRGSILC